MFAAAAREFPRTAPDRRRVEQLSCGDVGFDNAWKIQFFEGIKKLVMT